MQEIFELQALFGLSVALFEVPTGYVADLWSRKASLVLGGLIAGVCFSLLPFATTYWSLALFEITIAIGASLSSGADIALVYDSMPSSANRSQVIGRINQWELISEGLASLLSGVLVMWSFSAVVWAQAIVGWGPFLVSLFFTEPPIERMRCGTHLTNVQRVFSHVLVRSQLVRLIFLNCLAWGLSSFFVVWLLQPYWLSHKIPLEYFGIMWATLMFVSAFSSKYAHALEAALGARGTLLVLALAACFGYFFMAMDLAVIGICAGALFYINRGLASVILTDAFNWKIPSEFRATANSMRSLSFRLSFALFGPLIGCMVERVGLPTTLFLLGAVFSTLVLILMLPLCNRIEELRLEYIPE
jgi:MFS family permease